MLSPEEIVVLRSQIEQAEQLLGQFQRQASASPQVIAALQRQIADDKAALKEAELIVSRQHSMTIQGNARVGVAVAGDVHGSIVVKQLPVRVPQYPSQEEIAAGKERIALLPIPPVPIPPVRPFLLAGLFPLRANPLFVGRDAMLQELAVALKPVGAKAAISTGIGGVGKTTLAAEFAHRYGHYFLGGVFWISCADPQTIAPQIASYGGPGGLEVWHPDEELSLDERVARVRRQWESELPRLLVFDNCDDWTSAAGELSAEVLLGEWMPHIGGSRVLVTSRRQDWSPALGVSDIQLDVLARRDSIRLLQSIASYLSDADANQIADAMGDLPLALYLAAGYLRRYQHATTVASFLAELLQIDPSQHRALRGDGTSYPPTRRYLQRPNSEAEIKAELNVGRIFALSFDHLQVSDAADAAAIALIARAACLAPSAPFARPLLLDTLNSDRDAARFTAVDGLSRLLELGMLEKQGDDLRIHRLVSQYAQRVTPDQQAQEQVAGTLISYTKTISLSKVIVQLNGLLPHLHHLDTALRAEDNKLPSAMFSMVLGGAAHELADYKTAEKSYEYALELLEENTPLQELYLANSLNNIANLYSEQGKLDQALDFFQRSLVIVRAIRGDVDIYTATTLANIAAIYEAQNKDLQAQQVYEQALDSFEQLQELRHPLALQTLHNLAYLYSQQQLYAKALQLYELALLIRTQVFEPNHPDIAQSLNSIGVLYRKQGRYEEAQTYYERALNIYKVTHGKHPHTATVLHNMGYVYAAQRKYREARDVYELAWDIRFDLLGINHIDTGQTCFALAKIYVDRHIYDKAEPLLFQHLSIQKTLYGEMSLEVAHCLANLAALYEDMGLAERFEKYALDSLSLYEKTCGLDHQTTADALLTLIRASTALGEFERALQLAERALTIYKSLPQAELMVQSIEEMLDSLDSILDLLIQTETAVERALVETDIDQADIAAQLQQYIDYFDAQEQPSSKQLVKRFQAFMERLEAV
jgi:tetratricopeptide (TPR) repeat protein